MSVSGVSSSNSLNQSMQAWQARTQKIQNEFQQLGQDLQAGNHTQAQSDFSTLSKNISSPMQSNGALSQAFSALGTALQSGGLAVAQKAYTTLQQGVEQAGHAHTRHHHTEDSSQTTSASSGSSLSQLFASLGSALQSGNLSAAQTAYSGLEQGLTQLDSSSGNGSQSVAGVLSMLG
jgi:outer membrane protein assembly factor BamD (BamD/ComL family)